MKETIHLKSVSQFHELVGQTKPKHPLVSIEHGFEYTNHASQFNGIRIVSDLYLIVLKEGVCGKVIYGRNSYDFDEGTLLFFFSWTGNGV